MADRFSLRRLLLPIALFAVAIIAILTTNSTATATSYTFTPAADAYVVEYNPSLNTGSQSTLRIDGTTSAELNSYLRFDVQNLDGAVSSATLRLYVADSDSTGYDVHAVSDTSWGESTITYNNAPAIGSQLGSSGATTANNWVEVDVTSHVTGDGLVSFAVTTSSANLIRFSSKEGAQDPELVIETGSGATNTPTATPTNTPTGTPTFTPTPTPTGPTPTPTETPSPTPTSTPGGGSSFTFTPVADAYVVEYNPDLNTGAQSTLRIDGTTSAELNSYLRFDVQNLDGTISSATLRLYIVDSDSTGYDVHSVSDTSWGETTITYNNAPTIGSQLNSSGAVTANNWIEIDVTSHVTGTGLVSFAVTTSSANLIRFSSKEGNQDPELVIETGSTPTPTFTPTPTATPTAAPGRNWQQVTTTNAPAAVGEYAMAYGNGTVVLYGGNATGWPYENSSWKFNGTDWAEATPASQPNAVYGMSMVYDDNNDVMVLFGGSDDTDTALAETWTFEASSDTWTQLTPTNSPPARSYAQMVYTGTASSTEIYLFGGNDGTTYYNDLWLYDGSDWTQVSTNGTLPTARTHHAIAYDPGNDIILLFGGRDATGTLLANTWQLDVGNNDTWSQIMSTGPSARMAHGLAYDPTNGNFVLVGGANNGGDTILNDTWHFSSSAWTEATPSQAAPNAAYHLLIYDITNDLFQLFVNGETWQYE